MFGRFFNDKRRDPPLSTSKAKVNSGREDIDKQEVLESLSRRVATEDLSRYPDSGKAMREFRESLKIKPDESKEMFRALLEKMPDRVKDLLRINSSVENMLVDSITDSLNEVILERNEKKRYDLIEENNDKTVKCYEKFLERLHKENLELHNQLAAVAKHNQKDAGFYNMEFDSNKPLHQTVGLRGADSKAIRDFLDDVFLLARKYEDTKTE